MTVCTIHGAELRVHPLMLLVVAGACVLGRLYELLQIFLALSLHEFGHALAAKAFGCTVNAVELQPFGAVLRLADGSLSPHGEWCVALTGPVTSFVLAGAAAMVGLLFPATGARMGAFLSFNLTLGLINLLPALPLDGGRVAKCALLPRMGLSAATKLTAWAGVAAGLAMLAATALAALYGVRNLTLPVMGAFLLLAAGRELRLLPEKRMALLIRHGAEVTKAGMQVHEIAAGESMEAREALRLLRENSFNVIRVINGNQGTLGELDEHGLLVGMVRLGGRATVGALLKDRLTGQLQTGR